MSNSIVSECLLFVAINLFLMKIFKDRKMLNKKIKVNKETLKINKINKNL